MPTRTQYRSAGSEQIRELLRHLNQLKVLPFGYPNDLALRTGATLNAARETVKAGLIGSEISTHNFSCGASEERKSGNGFNRFAAQNR